MSKSKSNTARQRFIRAGFAVGAATTLLTALSAAPAYAVAGTLSLSSSGGPTGGGNTIVATLATTPTAPNPTTFTSATAVYFVVASSTTATPVCPTAYPATAPSSTVVASTSPAVKLLAPNKIAVVVPSGVSVSSSIYKYAVCAFQSSTAGALLIAGSQYTVGNKPTIAAVGAVSPVSGPALGNTTINVTGTGFLANTTANPNNTVATIDGQPLTNVSVAGDGLSFSATTPPHAAGGPYLLSITTPGGSVNTLTGGSTKAALFSYTNGIVVSPNTSPNSRGNLDVDILGVGFANLAFDATTGATPGSANAHVYLTQGAYDEEIGVGTTKTKPELSECINVLVIADTELLCTLPLNHTYDGAAPSLLVSAGAARANLTINATSGTKSITSPDAAFTQNDVGTRITSTAGNTVIAANSLITAVASPTSATISVNAASTGQVTDGNVGGPRGGTGTFAAGTINGTDKKTITGAVGFSKADIGRQLSSTAAVFPANTTIVSVTDDGTGAVASNAATNGGAMTDLTITPLVPVPNGTYTLQVVSNGVPDAKDLDNTYQQSIISSGSTFTVSDY